MKPALLAVAIAALALACSSCSMPGGGDGVSEAECRAVFVKRFELQGTPEAVSRALLPGLAEGCAEHGALSREDFECAVESTSLEQYQACGIVFVFD